MRKILYTICFLLLVSGCSSKIGADKIDDNLKLKAPKDRIYTSFIVDDVVCGDYLLKTNCVNKGKIVKYYYLKSVKDSKRKFNGEIKVKQDNEELLGANENITEKVTVSLDEIDRDYDRVTYGYYATDTKVSEIFEGVQFVKELATGDWYELESPATTTLEVWNEEATTTAKWYEKILGHKAFATETTFYPEATAGTVTADGRLAKSGLVWLTQRNAATADDAQNAETDQYACLTLKSGTTYYIYRTIYTFNTAAIGTDTISSASFYLYENTAGDAISNSDTDTVIVSSSTPASNSNIVTGDYNDIGGTVYGSKALAAFGLNQYNEFALNASGIANINASGISKFGVRMATDNTPSEPTGRNDLYVFFADYTGTDRDPKLVVTHASSGAPAATSTAVFPPLFFN